jgi:RND family efflux transporter MFP subunit
MKKALLVLAALIGMGLTLVVLRQQRGAAAPPAAGPASLPALSLAADDVVRLRRTALQTDLAVSGSLAARQSAMVKAKVVGELLQLTVREGDTVKAGQGIGQIDPGEYQLRLRQAEQQAQAASAQLEQAERALSNNQALVTQGFISATALDTSVSNAAAARANLLAAQAASDLARKSLADTRLVAPLTGLVSQRLAQPGERLALDARVVEIVDLSQLELEAAVAPQDAGLLQVGATAWLQVDGLPQAVSARLSRINPSASASSRTVSAYFDLAGQPGLRQGLFAKGRLITGQQEALVVPQQAIRLDQVLPSLILADGGRAHRVTVTLGASGLVDGVPMTAVLSGAKDGSLVLSGRTGPVAEGTVLRLPVPVPAPVPVPVPMGTGAAAASAQP